MVRGAKREEIKKAEVDDYLILDDAFVSNERKAIRFLFDSQEVCNQQIEARVSHLLSKGASDEDILLIAPSSFAEDKLIEAIGTEQIRPTTARALTLEILSTPEAREFTNRNPRLLSAYEEDFLLEDLKTLGTRPKRLRELLRFLHRGLSELADEGAGWLVTIEEKEVVAFLIEELTLLGGMLECELSNLATKVLRALPDVRQSFAKKHVIVSNYQCLSRASQLLCNLLACESIFVTANPMASIEAFETYHYEDGIEEFLAINPQCVDRREGSEPDAIGVVRPMQVLFASYNWSTPEAEFAHSADMIAEMINRGTPATRIALCVFHPHWGAQLENALNARGVDTVLALHPLKLRGDIRYLDQAKALMQNTAEKLLANENDAVSWRCWLGFGDALGKSGEFSMVKQQALLADDSHNQTIELIKRSSALSPVDFLISNGGNQTGSDLEELYNRQFFPTFAKADSIKGRVSRHAESVPAVRIGSVESLAGQNYDYVFVAGFNNGFFPKKEFFDLTKITANQQKLMEKTDTARLAMLKSLATKQIIYSHSEKTTVEAAKILGLKISRIIANKDGSQVALLAPSCYLKS
jgi:superfamily I DNA/RNA helicase